MVRGRTTNHRTTSTTDPDDDFPRRDMAAIVSPETEESREFQECSKFLHMKLWGYFLNEEGFLYTLENNFIFFRYCHSV